MKQMIRGNKDISEETRIAMKVSVISIVINLLLSLLKLAGGLLPNQKPWYRTRSIPLPMCSAPLLS